MDSSSDDRRVCQKAIRRLLAQRGWPLIGISEDDLVAATLDALHSEGCTLDEESITRCAAGQYVVAIYWACHADGTEFQAKAFQYLGERLTRIALCETDDEECAKDCAQIALIKIYQKLDTCRDPRGFFSWTRRIVLNEFYQCVRRHPEKSSTETTGSEGEGDSVIETDIKQSTVETPEDALAGVEDDITTKHLIQRIQQALGNSRQWRVIAEFYLNDRSYSEIAELLKTSTSNVRVLMHRAIQKLHSDGQLMQELQEFLGTSRTKGEA